MYLLYVTISIGYCALVFSLTLDDSLQSFPSNNKFVQEQLSSGDHQRADLRYMVEEEDFRIDSEVRYLSLLWRFELSRVKPIKLAYDLMLRRTRRFFPSHGRDHCHYSLCLPTEGWLG